MTIKKCNCEHKYQDKKYGKRMRVMNPLIDNKGFRCTVCGITNKEGQNLSTEKKK